MIFVIFHEVCFEFCDCFTKENNTVRKWRELWWFLWFCMEVCHYSFILALLNFAVLGIFWFFLEKVLTIFLNILGYELFEMEIREHWIYNLEKDLSYFKPKVFISVQSRDSNFIKSKSSKNNIKGNPTNILAP